MSDPQEKRPPRSFAGGTASVAEWSAVAPWLCVTVYRRFCSEQRESHF